MKLDFKGKIPEKNGIQKDNDNKPKYKKISNLQIVLHTKARRANQAPSELVNKGPKKTIRYKGPTSQLVIKA